MHRMGKIAATVLLMLTLLAPLTSEASNRSRAFTRVPAVYQTPEGISMGSLGNLTVEVEPGEGYVYFSADPLTQIDTQGAARTAALVASYTLGRDPLSYNFYYRLESDSMIIGGPSAGAAMTVATIAALLGKEVRQDVVMTGMVNPDGTVGPVGGIPEKLEAAAKGGARVFLVPAGQRVVERTVPKQVKIGPLIMTTVEKEKVDLAELGKKLGVEVKEVSTIADAARYMIGIELERPTAKEPTLPKELKAVIERWVDHYLKESESIREWVEANLSKLSYMARNAVEKVLALSEELSNKAKKELTSGLYYTASSSAFQSTFEAEYARSLVYFAISGPKSIDLIAERVSDRIDSVGSKLNGTRPSSLSSLEALIAAKTRYYMARDALSRATLLASKKVYFDSTDWGALHWLSYAYWRAETAETWTWLFGVGKGETVPESRLRKVASVMLYEAESVVSYAVSLLQDIGATSDLLNEASDDLDRAGAAFSSGDLYGSLGLTTSALAKATASIHQWFTSDPEAVRDALRKMSYSSINELLRKGIIPVLALSYAETAKIYERSGNQFDSIVYFELSSAHAHMLSLLTLAGGQPKQTLTTTPTATGSELPATTPTTVIVTVPRTVTSTPERTGLPTSQMVLLLGALLIGLLAGYLLGKR